jgi:hypothetical protein
VIGSTSHQLNHGIRLHYRLCADRAIGEKAPACGFEQNNRAEMIYDSRVKHFL